MVAQKIIITIQNMTGNMTRTKNYAICIADSISTEPIGHSCRTVDCARCTNVEKSGVYRRRRYASDFFGFKKVVVTGRNACRCGVNLVLV